MDAKGFIKTTENIGRTEVNSVPVWVRVLLYKQPGKRNQAIGGTLGLSYFGLRDLEYADGPLEPGFIMQHAWSTSEYLLRSGKTLQDGETMGVDGDTVGFKVSHAKDGVFVPFPVARLTLLTEKKKWWKW